MRNINSYLTEDVQDNPGRGGVGRQQQEADSEKSGHEIEYHDAEGSIWLKKMIIIIWC